MEEKKGGLWNAHLRVEAENWKPMVYFDLDEDGNIVEGSYKGIMYELLLFMQKARDAVQWCREISLP